MNFSLLTFSFTFLLLTSHCMAAQLILPDVFNVLKINGKAQTISFFASENTASLVPGKNILLLQYSELFEDIENDDHVTIKSEPFIVIFSVEIDRQYQLAAPKLTDEQSARVYAESPLVFIQDADNHAIELFSQNISEFQTHAALADIEHNFSAKQVNSAPLPASENTVTDQVEPTNKLSQGSENQALNMLKYWWAQADEKQKKTFSNLIKH